MKWFLFQIYLLSIFLTQSFYNAEAEKVEDRMIYSTSVMSMVKLLDLEESLKSNLEKYVQKTQAQLDMIKLYLDSIKREPRLTKLEEKQVYVANPLNAFPLLRSLKQDWPKPSLGMSRYQWRNMDSHHVGPFVSSNVYRSMRY